MTAFPICSDLLFSMVVGSARRMKSFSAKQRLHHLASGWYGVVRAAMLHSIHPFVNIRGFTYFNIRIILFLNQTTTTKPTTLYKRSKLTGKHRHKNKFKLIKLPFLSVSLIRSPSFALSFTYLTFSPHTISLVTFSLLCTFSLPPFKFFTIRLTRHSSPLNGCKLLYLHFLYF